MIIRPAAVLALLLALLALGSVLLLRSGCRRDDGPRIIGQIDTVPDTVLIATRPRIVTRWRDRIIIKTVPARVTVSQGVPDTAFALRYARRALAADSARRAKQRGDSIARQPGPILPPASGTFDGKRLTLWLTRSDGSLMEATAKLRPRFWFWAGTDRGSDTLPIFRGDRFWVRALREVKGCSIPTAVLSVVGGLADKQDRLRGVLIGGGSGFLGCVVG